MPLPKNFQFSATSLQDYVDCPRRFQLRYVLQVAWPSPEAEPLDEQERNAQLARDFHRLVHQHLLGIPVETLSASIHHPDLERWWKAYLAFLPTFGNARIVPEIRLSIPLAKYRVLAQYDAVVLRTERSVEQSPADKRRPEGDPALLIVDWKTYRQRPSRDWLAGRLQSRVYPVVLIQAEASLLSGAVVKPEEVEMCYWLAEFPQAPESFSYDTPSYQSDLEYLLSLATEIGERVAQTPGALDTEAAAPSEIWPLTSDSRHCRFCNYRSLCGRGSTAGPMADYVQDSYEGQRAGEGAELGFDLDWGQVQEVAY